MIVYSLIQYNNISTLLKGGGSTRKVGLLRKKR